ncbi:hypothetical protein WR25_11747 [Diploscapter pachys]|uniref:Ketoreductase domain-containing protein n=1 Tax=Diploscapter pachys TaxID=2018661 RepID=A0A2A2KPI5_9BILA|nr:hypothetical protein WR25_11747 [Diploscapter pachys]
MAGLLTGKTALITGGGSGIGKAICARMAKQGAQIIAVDLQKETVENMISGLENPSLHKAFGCDVSNADQVNELHKQALEFLKKPPSVLVNCAGITQDVTLLKMTRQQWDKVLDVNLTGVFLMTQAFVRSAVDQQASLSVVNISSIIGKIGNFGQTNYAATKAGVIAFSKSAAKVLENICSGIPMGRMGQGDEIADAVVFFASDMSSYVTGTTLEVTGGYCM